MSLRQRQEIQEVLRRMNTCSQLCINFAGASRLSFG
jgi:hypothetical protein